MGLLSLAYSPDCNLNVEVDHSIQTGKLLNVLQYIREVSADVKIMPFNRFVDN